MAATTIGTVGTWGVASAETGLLIETIKWDFAFRGEKPVLNEAGETVGVALYDELCTITLSALVSTTSAFAGDIGAALTVTNTTPSHMSDTNGKIVTKSISRTHAIEDFNRVEITAMLYPLITA